MTQIRKSNKNPKIFHKLENSTKIRKSKKNSKMRQKFETSTKKKSENLTNIRKSDKNPETWQKSKIWQKSENFIKNRKFDIQLKIRQKNFKTIFLKSPLSIILSNLHTKKSPKILQNPIYYSIEFRKKRFRNFPTKKISLFCESLTWFYKISILATLCQIWPKYFFLRPDYDNKNRNWFFGYFGQNMSKIF